MFVLKSTMDKAVEALEAEINLQRAIGEREAERANSASTEANMWWKEYSAAEKKVRELEDESGLRELQTSHTQLTNAADAKYREYLDAIAVRTSLEVQVEALTEKVRQQAKEIALLKATQVE
jgi:hypothetical protein